MALIVSIGTVALVSYLYWKIMEYMDDEASRMIGKLIREERKHGKQAYRKRLKHYRTYVKSGWRPTR